MNKLSLPVFRQGLEKKYIGAVKNYFEGDEQKAIKFITMAVDYVRKTPKLLETEPTSLLNAFMTIASFKLMPSPVVGEAYVIPYGDKAQFQLGYKGYVTLAYRSGMVRSITADVVRENDEFSIENGRIIHKIDFRKSNKERGEPIGAWVKVELTTGGVIEKYMHKDDILDIAKRFSKAYGRKDSPWNADKDPERWMWKKTVFLQLVKFIPKNEELVEAVEKDVSVDSKIIPQLDADSVASKPSSHNPTDILNKDENEEESEETEKILEETNPFKDKKENVSKTK